MTDKESIVRVGMPFTHADTKRTKYEESESESESEVESEVEEPTPLGLIKLTETLDDKVVELKIKLSKQKDKNILKELTKLIDVIDECQTNEKKSTIIDIENGQLISTQHGEESVGKGESFIFDNIDHFQDGTYVQIIIKRNNFIDRDQFLDTIKDYFYHVDMVEIYEEYATRHYFSCYIKLPNIA